MDSKTEVSKDNKYGEETKQYIKFDIANQSFGIDVLKSREIVREKEITVIPESPVFVKGVIDLRNEIVPIVSLSEHFNMMQKKDNDEKKIIIISIDDTMLGLEVNKVEEIVKIAADEIQHAPDITRKYNKDYIKGVAKLNDSLLVILAVEKIFSREEIEKVKKLK